MPSRKSTSTAPTNAIPVEISLPVQTPKEVLLSPAESAPLKKSSGKKKKVIPVVAVEPEPVVEIKVEPITEEIKTDPVDDVVVENLEEETIQEDTVMEEEGGIKKRTRRLVNKESLRTDFENLFSEYTEEIASTKKRGTKKLSLDKYLHKLQNDVFRLLKIRPNGEERKARAENSNSGFMKPVKISPDLAKFINVSVDDPITRVLITKKICEYIKEKDLQNPDDRREIIPDESLRKIFNLVENEEPRLTYYSIQKKIQTHIRKD